MSDFATNTPASEDSASNDYASDGVKAPFQWPVRVYIEDTDAGGIVFYANYLKFMERARTEWVRSRGVALRAGLFEGISFVVHRLEVRYNRPARLDDELRITAEVVGFGRTYMDFRQEVSRAGDPTVLVSAQVRVACTNLETGRPKAMPEALREALRFSRYGTSKD